MGFDCVTVCTRLPLGDNAFTALQWDNEEALTEAGKFCAALKSNPAVLWWDLV